MNEEEAAYYRESEKIKVTCCCIKTSEILKKLYDFKDFISETDYKIFKESLMKHPFGNHFKTESNEQPTREDLLEAIIKIKDWAGYIGHIDLKNYFLECMQTELTIAAKKVIRYGDPTAQLFFEKHWNDLIHKNIVKRDDLLSKKQFYNFEDWLNGKIEIPNLNALESFSNSDSSKIIAYSEKLIRQKAEKEFEKLKLTFSTELKDTFDKGLLLETYKEEYFTILEKELTENDKSAIKLAEDHVVYFLKKYGLPCESVEVIRKHYEWHIKNVINCIVANPQNEDSYNSQFYKDTPLCVSAIAYAKYYKYLKEYDIKANTLLQSTQSIIESPQVEFKPEINYFCNGMPLSVANGHFKVFTTKNNKNGKPFLTDEQFKLFIERAFHNNTSIDKQTFNQGKGERLFLVKRFYEFYVIASNEYEPNTQCKPKYISLLVENFTGWDLKTVANNFKTKTNRIW